MIKQVHPLREACRAIREWAPRIVSAITHYHGRGTCRGVAQRIRTVADTTLNGLHSMDYTYTRGTRVPIPVTIS